MNWNAIEIELSSPIHVSNGIPVRHKALQEASDEVHYWNSMAHSRNPNPTMLQYQNHRIAVVRAALLTFFLLPVLACQCFAQQRGSQRSASHLADISGLVWLGSDAFLAVHDAKVADEKFKPRVATLQLPKDLRGVTFKDSRISFKGIIPNDLESAAAIPNSKWILLSESGDSKEDPAIQRIFKATVNGNRVRIKSVTPWPVSIYNVEATAVARVDRNYVFIFAERASQQRSTQLQWIKFNPRTMEFDKRVNHVTFANPDPERFNRVIVGLDVDSNGTLYGVSAYDAETAGLPNPDDGPFAAGVYAIGTLLSECGEPTIQLFEDPTCLGISDGYKIESVAVRPASNGTPTELYIGTDDENYGGTIRLLPPAISH